MGPELRRIEDQLKRKLTFEEGVKGLECFIQLKFLGSDKDVQKEAIRLVGRVHTLLKSRYSSPAFWKKGESLFKSAKVVMANFPEEATAVSGYLQSAEAEIHARDGPENSGASAANNNTSRAALFEGQLSMETGDVRGSTDSIPILSEILTNLQVPELGHGVGSSLVRSGARGVLSGDVSEGTNNGSGIDATRTRNQDILDEATRFSEELHRIQVRIMEAVEATNLGMESVLAGMETVEQGVQDVLIAVRGNAGPSTAPPAAKAVVDSLPERLLNESEICTLGDDTTCPVCMDSFRAGGVITGLPCKHIFHIKCLKEWLRRKNSCPLCRHELPTDDRDYELRKERDEERRGAENALSHNEFMYI